MSSSLRQVKKALHAGPSSVEAGTSVSSPASPPPAAKTSQDQCRWTDCLDRGRSRCKVPGEILIGVLPGEGIGPEIMRGSLDILDVVAGACGLRVRTREGGLIGRDAERSCGATLPDAVIEFCKDIFEGGGAILNGPGGGRYVYELRKQLDLFLKISPLQAVNGVSEASCLRPELLRDVDILIVRENCGGVYQGEWTSRNDKGGNGVAGHHFTYSEPLVRRFLMAAARLAQLREGHMSVVWKESGVPSVSALWRDCAAEAAERFGIRHSMVDVDLMAYRLIQEAPVFDVIAAPNLFGDVLADVGAVLLGGRGVSYSGNFDEAGNAIYQTNHGAAYDLAGLDQANPAGQIHSMAMMLRESFGLQREADAIVGALRSVWRAGWRTADVATAGVRPIGTREFVARVGDSAAAIVGECESVEPEVG